jgi:anti-sigma factor RsiW
MHKPVEDGLEDYLSGRTASDSRAAFDAHLDECEECRELVGLLREQSELFGSLRAPEEEMSPAPGFYARVMDRIEAQSARSPWSIFIEPLFARRLVYASLAMAALLAFAAIRSPEEAAEVASVDAAVILGNIESGPLVEAADENPRRDRDAVLVKLVTYGSGPDLPISSD